MGSVIERQWIRYAFKLQCIVGAGVMSEMRQAYVNRSSLHDESLQVVSPSIEGYVRSTQYVVPATNGAKRIFLQWVTSRHSVHFCQSNIIFLAMCHKQFTVNWHINISKEFFHSCSCIHEQQPY